jgi:hypothetical protein
MTDLVGVDQNDLEELERFLGTHVGQVYRQRLLEMMKREARTCQDVTAPLDKIRAAQGALVLADAVLRLPETLRGEIEKRNKAKET